MENMMAFENFFTTLSQTGSDAAYTGVFGTTASSISLSSNLGSLSAEGAEIVKWVRYRLGEPKLTVELDNLQVYAMFEEANIEYSSIINRFTAKNWLANLLGLSRNFATQDLTNKLPHQTLDYLRRLAEPFASEAGFGGLQNPRKAYINQATSSTDYNMLTDFIDEQTGSSVEDYTKSVGQGTIQVRQVWYPEPSTVYRYFDPHSSTNVLSQEFQYESFNNETIFQIYPIWTDILRAGMLETNDRVRRSNVTYNIHGNRIRLLPKPNRNLKIWIEYTTDMDPFNPGFAVDSGDPSVTGISNISNVPFKDITYTDVNASGKNWIRLYCLALCMETLGRVRRKFTSVPVPGSEIQLDGDALVAEGMEKQEGLKERLREELNETTNLELMKQDAELAESIELQYQRIPFPVPIFFFG
jgi:hypothetical protein